MKIIIVIVIYIVIVLLVTMIVVSIVMVIIIIHISDQPVQLTRSADSLHLEATSCIRHT